jgi:threonine/homoserine/homoserine lactone efflux protein
MTLELIIALIGFAFVSSITPGPNNLMLLASGMNFGFLRTIPHMLGISLGFGIMCSMIGLGLGEAFDAYPQLYVVLKILAVLYMSYLAYKIATAAPLNNTPLADTGETGKPLTFLQAAAFQWVNPKAVAMALTAISAYAPREAGSLALLMVAGVFTAINLPSVSVWTVLGQQMRKLLSKPKAQRAFNIGCAALLMASLYPIIMSTAL